MERPLSCSECQKEISVCYSTVVEGQVKRTWMCSNCPFLEEKLFGPVEKKPFNNKKKTLLACAHCQTNLEQIRLGSSMGCSECYQVFAEVLSEELIQNDCIAKHTLKKKNAPSFHVGRTPSDVQELSPTVKLIALNEALDETLIREDYEQAALLRDQIKELKSKYKDEKPS